VALMVATAAPRVTVESKAHQLADRVECVAWRDGVGLVYAVPSLTADGFYVVVDVSRLGIGRGLKCDCEAGSHGKVCAHATAVAIARERHAARRRGRP